MQCKILRKQATLFPYFGVAGSHQLQVRDTLLALPGYTDIISIIIDLSSIIYIYLL